MMLPEGIGHVNFYTSIISYITLFSCLGIPVYAIKATAAVRNNMKELNVITIEIVSLNLILNLIAYSAVAIISITVPKVSEDIPLFLVLSLSIVFTTIGCEWFYKGIEDFKYITIRGLVVKTVSVILLFSFVKSKDDILIYGFYTVIGSIGGNVFNFLRLKKYISFKFVICEIHPFRHLKPVLHVFLFSAVTSFYIQLNTIILGFMKDSADVGIYTAALRIFGIVNSIIGSLSTVMLPRMSNLVTKKDNKEIQRLTQKAYDFSISMALPIIIGLIVCSPSIIHLLCGDNFAASVNCVRLMAPIMLFVSISSLLGYQVLYPMGHLNIVIVYCLIGCVVNITLDMMLIPEMSYEGVSIAYVTTELVVSIIAIFVSRRFVKICFFTKLERDALFSSVFMIVVFYFLRNLSFRNDIVMILFNFICGASTYLLSMVILKNPIIAECIRMIKK